MIVVNLDVMMAKRKMSLSQLSEKVDITLANLSIRKTTRPRPSVSPRWRPSAPPWTGQPGDILEFVPDEEAEP